MKKFLSTILVTSLLLGGSGTAFANITTLNDDVEPNPYSISDIEVTRLAELNNMDPVLLKEAIEAGPDADGRYSPFSKVPQLNNGITNAELAERDKQKSSSTGAPLILPKETSPNAPVKSKEVSKVSKTNEDVTAYNKTGNKTANNNDPVLGIAACHRKIDIGLEQNYQPVIAFGTTVYLDRYVWLPDGNYRSQFVIDDTGSGEDKNGNQLRTNYWLDIYYADDTASAKKFGVIKMNYNYFEN